jgi:hypothetical protein
LLTAKLSSLLSHPFLRLSPPHRHMNFPTNSLMRTAFVITCRRSTYLLSIAVCTYFHFYFSALAFRKQTKRKEKLRPQKEVFFVASSRVITTKIKKLSVVEKYTSFRLLVTAKKNFIASIAPFADRARDTTKT